MTNLLIRKVGGKFYSPMVLCSVVSEPGLRRHKVQYDLTLNVLFDPSGLKVWRRMNSFRDSGERLGFRILFDDGSLVYWHGIIQGTGSSTDEQSGCIMLSLKAFSINEPLITVSRKKIKKRRKANTH